MVLLHDGGAPADLVEADQITTALRVLGPRNPPPVALTAAPRDPRRPTPRTLLSSPN